MKKVIALLFLVIFQSCNYFDKSIPSEQELLDKQLKEINWDEVDTYPTISDCDSITDEAQRKQCFFDVLTSKIQEKLSVDTLSILFPDLDTIQVKVTINTDKTMVFEPQFPQDSIAYDKVKVDSILKATIVNLPEINPALKRGIPVKTQFILPVIIKIEK